MGNDDFFSRNQLFCRAAVQMHCSALPCHTLHGSAPCYVTLRYTSHSVTLTLVVSECAPLEFDVILEYIVYCYRVIYILARANAHIASLECLQSRTRETILPWVNLSQIFFAHGVDVYELSACIRWCMVYMMGGDAS